ncbi:hypothetical protein BWQ96_00219 [Gracilariopsis chorda]|uniref:Fe2OG dioxygenase domain-containing protein n=1 Tax=Gracilariopsis chorda TaxID=448386 RepID=A0A2V3J6N3_9FLOR|nr:hypothetical protein BWQ96_00219 [Gracilariopsis chorda]|eukprot:PXF50059.1 hypothetical protein BWQ96_00219 [Gracilariopsis chorda]
MAVIASYKAGERNLQLSVRKTVDRQAATSMVIQALWCTPIARTHLRTHPLVKNISAFNERLSAAIIQDHAQFLREETNGEEDLVALNDRFFEFQSGTGEVYDNSDNATQGRLNRLQFRHTREFAIVANAAARMAEAMLRKWGATARRSARKRRLQAWATVHEHGSRHPLHVHDMAIISIVYYVKSGENSGALRLLDARGPRPPFEGSVEVSPVEGEMVAFPGWLAHEVESGSGEGVRVSLVLNVRGSWHGTDELDAANIPLGSWSGDGEACTWLLDWGGDITC